MMSLTSISSIRSPHAQSWCWKGKYPKPTPLTDTLLETPIYRSRSRKLIQPGRLVSDTRSLVWREGQSALMASTCGARASLVTMDLALAACSRYLRSFAVSWEIPGIMTTPWATQRREVVRQEGDSNADARETSGWRGLEHPREQ